MEPEDGNIVNMVRHVDPRRQIIGMHFPHRAPERVGGGGGACDE